MYEIQFQIQLHNKQLMDKHLYHVGICIDKPTLKQ